ncbi:LLM class flavin-dependent oxidoreductase [Streptomyces hainanensis]|uniref:LLM class flavin-dependent oxidoreductase n=1 Tax=Streptomyces hainanensis TaxID=402648 RepID=A0A4R4T223_9ACTN|nr:LLM class flavin-dependent oxidoreductase [Streptomyces hainanensis]TDC69284.1 LLM class flavin-dependent oxidoreductase [Streptomyces hainanensis]
MSTGPVPLSVLDLVPIGSGSTAGAALADTLDLARRAEEFGYLRYWIAEHHLAPGVAGSQPALVIALVAGATSRIRVGSGAVQLGHQTALSVVEQFGLLDALHPGRIDLGLGRSGHRGAPRNGARPPAPRAAPRAARRIGPLLIPAPFDPSGLLDSPRFRLQQRLLALPGAQPPVYAEQVDDIRALVGGTYRSPEGLSAHAVPGEGADLQLWILGSSAGESARVAGERGLRFAANYHVSPGTVLETVAAYRAAFRPSAELDRPHVQVSADVVVAEDDATARELAAGYGPWVRSIRAGGGAVPYPTPEEAAREPWTAADRALVADRVDTRFVGSPERVAALLRELRDATGADELLVTTITHDHRHRVRSYELLAEVWAGQGS